MNIIDVITEIVFLLHFLKPINHDIDFFEDVLLVMSIYYPFE